MKNSLQLSHALNSYAGVSAKPVGTFRPQIAEDLADVTAANVQDFEINEGFTLIDRSVTQAASIENLRQVLLFSNTSVSQIVSSYARLDFGMESRVVFPQGKKTKLSEAIEILGTVTTLISYGIAIALLTVVGKIFLYMTKKFYNTCAGVVKLKAKVKASAGILGKKANYLKSKEKVTISDVSSWSHASKVPKLLQGKTGKVVLPASALAKAIMDEWLNGKIKPYASIYHNDPSTYKQLVKESTTVTGLLVKNVENLDNLAKEFQAMARGKDASPRNRIALLNQVAITNRGVRESMAQFDTVREKYTPARAPKDMGQVSQNISSFNYDAPTGLLKTNDRLKSLEGRLKGISKTLQRGKDSISKEVDTEVSAGLTNIKKAIQDMYNQTKQVDMLFSHNTLFGSAYLDYLTAMASVEWSR